MSMDLELRDVQRTGDTLNHVNQNGSQNSNNSGTLDQVNQNSGENSRNLSNSVNGSVQETIIVIRSAETAHVSGENGDSEAKDNVLGSSNVQVEAELKTNVVKAEKHDCVIDVKCGNGGFGENWDEEKVCRICHLSSDQLTEGGSDLIQLGCGCKDELGIAHSHCAEAWFKLRGNRLCEICSETAKNVTGVEDNGFMVEWNESNFTGSNTNSSDRRRGCWRGQPFCNFLMALLVIAFVLPWFFRVNMF